MTNQQQPITPPSELVEEWVDLLAVRSDKAVFTLAAQWGADQELEACCALLNKFNDGFWCEELRAARRPKPPSLKEEALKLVQPAGIAGSYVRLNPEELYIIRRALEQLDD